MATTPVAACSRLDGAAVRQMAGLGLACSGLAWSGLACSIEPSVLVDSSVDVGSADEQSATTQDQDLSQDPTTGGTITDCTPPTWPDLIEPDDTQSVALNFQADAIASDPEFDLVWLCGRGMIATMPTPGGPNHGPATTLAWSALTDDATCRRILAIDDGRALVLASDATVGLFAATDTGPRLLHSVQVGPTSTPTRRAADLHEQSAVRAHDITLLHARILVAVGEAGIVELSIAGDKLVPGQLWSDPATIGTRALATVMGSHLVIADDQGGVRLLNEMGQPIALVQRRGSAVAAISDGHHRVAITRGGLGIELFEVIEDELIFVGQAEPHGHCSDVRFVGDQLLVNTALQLALLTADPTSTQLRLRDLALERRPGSGEYQGQWFRSLTRDGAALVATNRRVTPLTIHPPSDTPIIRFDRSTYSIFAQPGEPEPFAIVLGQNRGDQPLVLVALELEGPFAGELSSDELEPHENCPGQFVVPPRGYFSFHVRHVGPIAGHQLGHWRLHSNDPDQPFATARVEYERPPLELGQPGVDIVLPAESGALFTHADFAGRYLLMKIFNSE